MAATRRERVHHALQKAAATGDGWCCGRSLMHPKVGGNRYGARLHELRVAGVEWQSRTCICHRCRYANDEARRRGEVPPNVHMYRLTATATNLTEGAA